jgi:hypothetical protein
VRRSETAAALPDGDYVSAGMDVVRPDAAFPHLVIGDRDGVSWPYLRREIPHNWYVDARYPRCGVLSRDEALILYNTALAMSGRMALEIGCWKGWSTCHLLAGGVDLDVIDPLLDRDEFRVNWSLPDHLSGFCLAPRSSTT